MHIHFQLAQQCIQISTRINSSSVHTYIFVCSTLRVILQGFVTQNATTGTCKYGQEIAHVLWVCMCVCVCVTSHSYLCVRVCVCSYSLGEEFRVVVAGEREEAFGTGVELGDDVGEGLGADDRVLGEPIVLHSPTR